jgi:aminopeptidase YwaD
MVKGTSSSPSLRFTGPSLPVLLLTLGAGCSGHTATTTDPQVIASELREHVVWLASDELRGRRTGTLEAARAARYLAAEFRRYGLRPEGNAGGYLQDFPFVSGVELGPANRLAVVGRGDPLLLDRDWRPFAYSDDGGSDTLEVVFAGYGISVPDEGWDDYAGLDVNGKAVLVVPYGPPEEGGGMRFPRHHALRRKASNARDHGAVALLVAPHPDLDPADFLEPLRYDASPGSSGIRVVGLTLAAADRILGSAGALAARLQAPPAPPARPAGRGGTRTPTPPRIRLEVDIEPVRATGINVLGAVPALVESDTWIVIGAHYDHLGMGGEGSLVPDTTAVHNGADDNASGTAGLLELAQEFAAMPLTDRNLLFAAFAGEEEGLLGSAYLAEHLPPAAGHLEAMLNMDMVGRLSGERSLTVYGTGTSPSWDGLLDELNVSSRYGFKLSRVPDGYGSSDHASFYARGIPVLHFFTGTHGDYHRPTDDADRLNYPGEERVVRFIAALVRRWTRSPERLVYQATAQPEGMGEGRAGIAVYTGVVPDFGWEGEGFRISGVNDGSPAANAGLEPGDVILRMGERPVRNIYDYTYALLDGSPGQRVEMELRRGDRVFTVKIVLGNRRTH